MYPEKIVHSILNEHDKNVVLIVVKVNINYQLGYRSKNKDKPWGIATIYHPLLIKNLRKIKDLKKLDNYPIKSIN